MPTYEYECLTTDKRFERFQKMSDKPLSKCPECGGPVRRLLGTGSALVFKGSGFYATDYKKSWSRAPSCGRSRTCCGRDVPCENRPCDD